MVNDLSGDQRVHRIASSLQHAGYEVSVVGRKLPDSQPLSKRSYQTYRLRLAVHRGKLFYLMFNLRLFIFLMQKRPDILVANDLDTLLPNYLVSRLLGKKLVYDTHEYFTEVPELINRPATRAVWQRLEKALFPRLTHVYTVNEALAEIYQETYAVPVQSIRNLPLRRRVSIPARQGNILLYQGALNLGRGLELLIESMQFLPEYELWIIGKGDVEDALKAQAQAGNLLGENVHFQGFVPWEELAKYTAQASLGFSIEEDLGLNYRYASPNKVYDYIQASVPVMVSDLPMMRRTVTQYGVGEVITAEERKPEALAAKIRGFFADQDGYQACVVACQVAAEELNWQQEEEKLHALYHSLDSIAESL